MAQTFTCNCGAICRVDDRQIGRPFICWKCGAQTIVHQPDPEPPPVVAPPVVGSPVSEPPIAPSETYLPPTASPRRRQPRSRVAAPPLRLLNAIRQRIHLHMSVLRWVFLGLYVVVALTLFLFAWHGEDRLYVLILAVLMLASQCLFIFGGGTMELTRPIRKRRLWMPALVAASMLCVLLGGLNLALGELFYAYNAPAEAFWAGFWVALACNWLFWFLLILLGTRKWSRMNTLGRIAGGILAGSLAELLAAVPAHMIVSRRPGCFVGLGTMAGIFAGLYVMLFSMGPGIALLFLFPRHRREQLAIVPEVTPPWYRFQLRTLFLLLLLCSLPCAWLGYELNKAQANRARATQLQQEIAYIESLGTSVNTSFDVHPDSLDELTGNPGIRCISSVDGTTKFDDNALHQLQHLKRLRSLDLELTQISDTGLIVLEGFPKLYYLNLAGTNVTDAGLAHARGLKELREINLNKTNITDAGLAHLKDLPEVDELSLGNTRITDDALVHLREWKQLFYLDLSNTQITDAGLQQLEGLDLVILDLTNTQVTPAGISRFKQKVPDSAVTP